MSNNTILATTPLVSTNYLLRATGTTIGNSLIFDNGTNVGIGNTNTSYTLDVSGTGRFSGAATFSSSVQIQSSNGIKLNRSANDYYWQINSDSSNYLNFGAYLANGTPYGTNPKLILLDNGNVGIGTSTPTDIGGFTSLTINNNSNGPLIDLNNSGTNNMRFLCLSAADQRIYGAGALSFYTSGSNRMSIISGGQVQVKQGGNTHNDGFSIINNIGNVWNFVNGGDNNLYLGYNTVSKGVYNTAGVYTPLSDINKKKDFEDSTIGLNAILGLKPTLYRMIDEEESIDKHLGFIAQEVKEFIPQAYSESVNGEDTFIGLTEMPIIAALVKAIQEMNTKSEEQQALITSLQSQINELKNK